MVVTQPTQTGFARTTPTLATGGDIGAGLSKICIGSGHQQVKIRMPSKVVEVQQELDDILADKNGGYFQYVSGDREDLNGRKFLVGSLGKKLIQEAVSPEIFKLITRPDVQRAAVEARSL
jgi:hypothetical protein